MIWLLLFLCLSTICSEKIIVETDSKKIIAYNQHEVLIYIKDKPGKTRSACNKDHAALSTETTCNVFRLLKECGVPVSFHKQFGTTRFLAPKCEPIAYTVTVRRQAGGNYVKRNPHVKEGHIFPRLVVEFFLKTKNKKWKQYTLPYNNPYILFREGKADLYHPEKPIWDQEPFLGLDDYPLKEKDNDVMKVIEIAARTFLVLEKGWQLAGSKLIDCKLEFGIDTKGTILLSDVIDNDSWRLEHNQEQINKKLYFDEEELNQTVKEKRYVRDRTSQFELPKQQIIMWRASEKDDISPFINYLKPYANKDLAITLATRSMHKEPVQSYKTIMEAVQKTPDSVLVSFVGKSNGAGPTLSAITLVPTITVPMDWEKFPDDIWSSLRTPSSVPAMTVLDQENAALAALQILAKRNPRLYAQLLLERMNRLPNFVQI